MGRHLPTPWIAQKDEFVVPKEGLELEAKRNAILKGQNKGQNIGAELRSESSQSAKIK